MTKDEILVELKAKWDYWTNARLEEFYGNRPPPAPEQKGTWSFAWEVTDYGIYYIYKNLTPTENRVVLEQFDGSIYTLREMVIPNFWNLCRNLYIDTRLSESNVRIEIPISNEQVELDGHVWDFFISSAPDDEIGVDGWIESLLVDRENDFQYMTDIVDSFVLFSKILYASSQRSGILMCPEMICIQRRMVNRGGYYWRTCSSNLYGGFNSTYQRAIGRAISVIKILYVHYLQFHRVKAGLPKLDSDALDQLFKNAKQRCQLDVGTTSELVIEEKPFSSTASEIENSVYCQFRVFRFDNVVWSNTMPTNASYNAMISWLNTKDPSYYIQFTLPNGIVFNSNFQDIIEDNNDLVNNLNTVHQDMDGMLFEEVDKFVIPDES